MTESEVMDRILEKSKQIRKQAELESFVFSIRAQAREIIGKSREIQKTGTEAQINTCNNPSPA